MYCPNCNLEIEETENFCGNCGYNLKPAITSMAQQLNVQSNQLIPEYAKLKRIPKLSISVYICYVSILVGTITSLFVSPLYGLAFGVIGVIAGSFISRQHHFKKMLIGLSLSSLVILGSIGLFMIAYNHYKKTNSTNNTSMSKNAVISNFADTNCYSFTFGFKLYLSSTASNCSVEAYNALQLSNASIFYKVVAINDSLLTKSNFVTTAKPLLEKDINQNLPGFRVKYQNSTIFSGNLAYYVVGMNNSTGASVIEEAVYHPGTINNFYDIIYASSSASNVNINNLQSSWIWKN